MPLCALFSLHSGNFQDRFGGLEDDSDDFFEDDDEDDDKPKKKGKKGQQKLAGQPVKKGARIKECPGCGSKVGVSIKECPSCDYTFTSKSQLVQQVSVEVESENIRSRFPFEPEREEDGSLMIEKIMGRRLRKDKARQFHKASQFRALTATESKYDYEYLLKYKTLSYLHVQWCTAHEIDSMSKRSKMALTRYMNNLDSGKEVQEDGEVDPSFVEVRLLCCVVLCCALLCCVVLCCAVLCCR